MKQLTLSTSTNQNEFMGSLYEDYDSISSYMSAFELVLAVIFVLGISLNLVSIAFILKSERLNPISILIMNLALADLVYTAGIPLFISHAIGKSWSHGLIGCRVFILTDFIGVIVGIYTVTALSVERFFEVADKKKRLEKLSNQFKNFLAYVFLVLTWIIAILFSMPLVSSIRLEELQNNSFTCETDWTENKMNGFFIVKFVLVFALPFSIICFSSIKLLIFLKQSKILNQSINSTPVNRVKSKKDCMKTIRKQDTIKRDKKTKRIRVRKKAINTVLSIVAVFLAQWFPLWMAELYKAITTDPITSIQLINMIASLISYTNSITNPLLYMILTHHFRRFISKLTKGSRITNSPKPKRNLKITSV